MVAGHRYALPYLRGSVRESTADGGRFGPVAKAWPLFGGGRQVVVFADTAVRPASQLAERIARLGATAVIVDASRVMAELDRGGCLDPGRLPAVVDGIIAAGGIDPKSEVIVGGMDSGALLPLLLAESNQGGRTVNLSVGFSAKLPAGLRVCPPFTTEREGSDQFLATVPALKGSWHAIWSDYPAMRTAKLVRNLAKVEETITLYDTPPEAMLVDALDKLINPGAADRVPMAVVEIPAAGADDTVTLFYSGDGGWRDLDRIVAGEMARQGFPVVGIDTLRTFWTRKTPDLAARELSATLAHYRNSWGAKSFVLIGYSFGADLLAPVYNRLPAEDRNSIRLVIMLALSKNADFAIQVSGWVGGYSGEMQLGPELAKLPPSKIVCVYGSEEKADTGCTDSSIPRAGRIELPGGHHFDEDYPKLARLILERYRQAGREENAVGGAK